MMKHKDFFDDKVKIEKDYDTLKPEGPVDNPLTCGIHMDLW